MGKDGWIGLTGSVRFTQDTVIKTAPPSLLRVEVEKTIRAYKIAEDCGLFSNFGENLVFVCKRMDDKSFGQHM